MKKETLQKIVMNARNEGKRFITLEIKYGWTGAAIASNDHKNRLEIDYKEGQTCEFDDDVLIICGCAYVPYDEIGVVWATDNSLEYNFKNKN